MLVTFIFMDCDNKSIYYFLIILQALLFPYLLYRYVLLIKDVFPILMTDRINYYNILFQKHRYVCEIWTLQSKNSLHRLQKIVSPLILLKWDL